MIYITLVVFAEVAVLSGLVDALVASSYKWGFFAVGYAVFFYIWFGLFGLARVSSLALGREYRRTFITLADYLSFLQMLYLISWGLSEGGSRISPDDEMVFYGILDNSQARLHSVTFVANG